MNRRIEKAQKAAKGDKKFLHEVDVFKGLAEHLNAGKSARTYECDEDDMALIVLFLNHLFWFLLLAVFTEKP